MQLNMYLDGVLIESIPIMWEGLKAEQRHRYLEALSEKLVHRHRGKLIHTRHSPQFYVEGVPSKMNNLESSEEEV